MFFPALLEFFAIIFLFVIGMVLLMYFMDSWYIHDNGKVMFFRGVIVFIYTIFVGSIPVWYGFYF